MLNSRRRMEGCCLDSYFDCSEYLCNKINPAPRILAFTRRVGENVSSPSHASSMGSVLWMWCRKMKRFPLGCFGCRKEYRACMTKIFTDMHSVWYIRKQWLAYCHSGLVPFEAVNLCLGWTTPDCSHYWKLHHIKYLPSTQKTMQSRGDAETPQ